MTMKTAQRRNRALKSRIERSIKAKDIADGRSGDFVVDASKANFLAEFLASGKRPRLKGEFAEPGDQIIVQFTFHNGNAASHEFSWREYNRVLEAFKVGLLPRYEPIIQQTSQEPQHKAVWYKPSTWF